MTSARQRLAANVQESPEVLTQRRPHAACDAASPILEVDNVTFQYKTSEHLITATYQVGFDVYPCDRFVLLGPSGCGKSTLLKGVAGFVTPVEGEMRLKGNAIKEPGPDRVMVFQEFDQLLPWKTVKQNITFALRDGGRCRTDREADEIAMAYIGKVKLERFANTYPHMLSGGMKQRVAIARGMAMEPAILLMDEPFAALDALTRRQMQEELLHLWEDTKFTLMFVTHSIQEALIVGSRILVLSPHPGQVKAEINAHHVGLPEAETETFIALQRRIHDMLFADPIIEETGGHHA